MTLEGSDAEVEVLGTTLTFSGTQDGRASLGVGPANVSCAEGETVAAGPLSLECSSVEADRVEGYLESYGAFDNGPIQAQRSGSFVMERISNEGYHGPDA